jgi:hypothetical protein
MSDFVDALVDLLPEHNSLKSKRNPLRQVLDKSVGEWFDNHSVQTFYDNLFLNSATGGWLDLHGRDYGVYRRIGESDEDYRRRIVFEKSDYLTTELLLTVYGVGLFSYREDFNLINNTLVSDNVYLSDRFIGVSDNDTISILDKKYILDTGVTWVNVHGSIDYILNAANVNVLNEYGKIYNQSSLVEFFKLNRSIRTVKLFLPEAVNSMNCFLGCFALKNVDLDLPEVTNVTAMFLNCVSLETVRLNLPNLTTFDYLFNATDGLSMNIKSINVTIPVDIVSDFKSYILDLPLQYLTSLIINGEEVDLS